MTFNNDIEKTEAEIKVLQKKLDLLKEIETHKSHPKKPQTLKDIIREWIVIYNIRTDSLKDRITNDLVERIEKKWLPDEDDGDDLYARGWNNCLNEIKKNLKND